MVQQTRSQPSLNLDPGWMIVLGIPCRCILSVSLSLLMCFPSDQTRRGGEEGMHRRDHGDKRGGVSSLLLFANKHARRKVVQRPPNRVRFLGKNKHSFTIKMSPAVGHLLPILLTAYVGINILTCTLSDRTASLAAVTPSPPKAEVFLVKESLLQNHTLCQYRAWQNVRTGGQESLPESCRRLPPAMPNHAGSAPHT